MKFVLFINLKIDKIFETFFMLNSAEHEKSFKFLKIFIFMTKWNFILSWAWKKFYNSVEHEKSFITSEPVLAFIPYAKS